MTHASWKIAHGLIRGRDIKTAPLTLEVKRLYLMGITRIGLEPTNQLAGAEAYRRQGARLIGRLGSIRGGVYTSRMAAKPKLP